MSVTLSGINDATSYTIYMSTSKNGTYTAVKTLKSTAKLAATIDGLTLGTTY